jgi:UDP-3-O-[3-hydroxymyristoyl] glucosamine N-acyltransferase
MHHTLEELAQLVGGRVVGEGQTSIGGASPPGTATAGDVTLIDKAEHLKKLVGSAAVAAVVPAGVECPLPAIVVDDVHAAFTKIIHRFHPPRTVRRVGLSPRAVISPSARLAPNVDVHPHAVIGDDVEIGAGCVVHSGVQIMAGCKLGENVTIFPNAVLYEDTQIGSRCIIHAAAVLGAYGFGYRQVNGRHVLAAQLGRVELGDDVEVGAGTTIDRGAYGPTRIGEGTKIDDQVMIAHNCVIGRHNLICSQVGIAGSSSTGDYVVIAGHAGLRDHIHIGNGATLAAMAGVMNDVPDRATMCGAPAEDLRDFFVKQANLAKLPDMRKQLKELEKTVAELKRRLSESEPGSSAAAA